MDSPVGISCVPETKTIKYINFQLKRRKNINDYTEEPVTTRSISMFVNKIFVRNREKRRRSYDIFI